MGTVSKGLGLGVAETDRSKEFGALGKRKMASAVSEATLGLAGFR